MSTTVAIHSDKYCVFRSGEDRFCIPALTIRNVGPRPHLCRLPLTDGVLAGLAHEQQEFIPVYSFCTARGSMPDPQTEQLMLVLNNDRGPWGLLVDEVIGLESLELSLNSHRGRTANWSTVSVGSSSFKDHFVTAIDSQGLSELLQERLNRAWNQLRQHAVERSRIDEIDLGDSLPAKQQE